MKQPVRQRPVWLSSTNLLFFFAVVVVIVVFVHRKKNKEKKKKEVGEQQKKKKFRMPSFALAAPEWIVSVPFVQFAFAQRMFGSAPTAYEVVCGANDELAASARSEARSAVCPVRSSLPPDKAVLLALNHLLERNRRVTVLTTAGACEDFSSRTHRLSARALELGGVEELVAAGAALDRLVCV